MTKWLAGFWGRFRQRADKLNLFLALCLSALSVLCIYAIHVAGYCKERPYQIQALATGLGVCAVVVMVSFFDYESLAGLWRFYYPLTGALMVFTAFFGETRQGSDNRSWLPIPGVTSFQPSELWKFAFILAFAWHLAQVREDLNQPRVLIPVLLGISLAAFLLGRIAPGDPVDDALFRIGIEFPTEEDRADMRAELGLDRPLPVQYLDWLGDALRGDLGRSYIGNKDIAQELMTRLPITLKVSLAAMLAAVVFGVGGGVLMAACHGTWLDTVLKGLSTLLLSVPGFWLALFLITVFAEWLHLLPTSGLDRGLASLVLPAVALSAANVGSTSRFTRGNILAQLGEQYIVVANAKGLSQRAVMVGHAFRNSLVPIITLIGNYFGGILGGSTIIENIFAIPGLGSYVLSAIQNRDYPVIQGYVLITGTTFVLVTLAIDLLYIAVNPKIRLQGGEA